MGRTENNGGATQIESLVQQAQANEELFLLRAFVLTIALFVTGSLCSVGRAENSE